MAARAKEKDNNDKLDADALRIAKDTIKEIIDIVTDKKPLIDAAWEAAYKQGGKEQRRQYCYQKIAASVSAATMSE